MPGVANKSAPERVSTAERRARVVQMRRARFSFAEIGRREGISEQRAWQVYQAALKAIPAQAVSEHRAEELTLIDDAVRALLAIATDKTVTPRTRVEAWNSVRGWAERKARLLGLDAPVKVEVSDAVDAEIAALAARLAVVEPGGEAEAPRGAEAGHVEALTA